MLNLREFRNVLEPAVDEMRPAFEEFLLVLEFLVAGEEFEVVFLLVGVDFGGDLEFLEGLEEGALLGELEGEGVVFLCDFLEEIGLGGLEDEGGVLQEGLEFQEVVGEVGN